MVVVVAGALATVVMVVAGGIGVLKAVQMAAGMTLTMSMALLEKELNLQCSACDC
jgi:hypothetical protein